MNKIFYISTLLLSICTHAQYLTNGSAPVYTSFDYDNLDDDCKPMNEVLPIANRWLYDGDTPPIVCESYPVLFTDTPLSVSGGYCMLTTEIIDSQLTGNSNQNIRCNLVSILANTEYKISFLCANLGSTSPETSGDWDSNFTITIGNRVFTESIPPLGDGTSVYWHEIEITFCGTTEEQLQGGPFPVIISAPNILNGEENMSVKLAIEGIEFDKRSACTYPPPPPCINCTSFAPVPNEKYIISGWVKQSVEDGEDQYSDIADIITYESSYIEILFSDDDDTNVDPDPVTFYPSGEIIDGWQKILGEFTVPADMDFIDISLKNESGYVAFFDDIRIHPYNGNLKSFVYDEQSNKLVAELDENNYATFYEYDQEGGLVRVKKETKKGIFTIQESRSSTVKK